MPLKKMQLILIFSSLLVLAAGILYSDPIKLISTVSGSDPSYILYAFVFSNIAILARTAKWRVILENVKFRDLVPIQLLGVTISNFSPGKVAEPTKALILKMKTKISVSETLQSIIWERVLDILVLLFLAFSVLQVISLSGKFLSLSIISMAGFLLLVSLLLAGLKRKAFGYKLFYFCKRFPILSRIDKNFIENFYGRHVGAEKLIMAFGLTLLAWILDGIVFSLAFRSIGIDINPLFMAGLISLATIVGIISFLPGGVGSMELAMLFLLGTQGVERTAALSGILLSRFLSIWYVTFLGGLSFIHLSRKIELKNIFK